MASDPALSGYGVVRAPGLLPADASTVVANLGVTTAYPGNTPLATLAAALGGAGPLGAITVTTINGLTITTTTGTLTLVNGSSLITAGANAVTLTSTGTTNVTLPTSGTLATIGGSLATYTWATLPGSYATGQPVWVSDIGNAVMGASPVAATGSLWVFNGTVWVPAGGSVTLAKLDTAITGLTNSEAISAKILLPAGFLQVNDRLNAAVSVTKSGTTDTGSIRTRMGSAGTTADADIGAGTILTAPSVSARGLLAWRVASATSLQRVGLTNGGITGTAGTMDAATISNISGALYFDFGATSSSTNNTVGLLDINLVLVR